MLGGIRRMRAENLWKRATALLSDRNYDEALAIAERLEDLHHTAAFEVAATAYAGLGKQHEAIQALERGARIAPKSWGNWELLGNYYSDAGRFAEAAQAYEAALRCESVWIDSIFLNQATLSARREDFATALKTLEQISDRTLALRVNELKACILLQCGAPQEAFEICTTGLETAVDDSQADALVRLHATRARAMIALGKPTEEIEDFVRASLTLYPTSDILLKELATLKQRRSERALLFDVVMHFDLDQATRGARGPVGFVRSAQVIADTPEEATTLLAEIEPQAAPSSYPSAEITVIQSALSRLKGVVSRSPRFYFNR